MKSRQTRGMTQVELAQAVGVSQRTISYYETESQHPPSTILMQLADVLGVQAEVLLCREDPRADLLAHDTLLARKFLEAENLPPADRKTIADVIDALVSKQAVTAQQ